MKIILFLSLLIWVIPGIWESKNSETEKATCNSFCDYSG